jgi:hypothetical protein
MLAIDKTDTCEFNCTIEDEAGPYQVNILVIFEDGLRGFTFGSTTLEATKRLYNSVASMDFARQFWRYYDGEVVVFPLQLRED